MLLEKSIVAVAVLGMLGTAIGGAETPRDSQLSGMDRPVSAVAGSGYEEQLSLFSYEATLASVYTVNAGAGGAGAQQADEDLTADQRSEREIRDLTNRWAKAWNVGDRDFQPEAFRELFAPGERGISVFDNVQGDVIRLESVDQYISTWGPFMAPLTQWSVRLANLEIQVQGEIAFSTFRLVGTDTRGPAGKPIPFGQYGTHVWQRIPDLGWRIVHEHLTAYDVSNPAHES